MPNLPCSMYGQYGHRATERDDCQPCRGNCLLLVPIDHYCECETQELAALPVESAPRRATRVSSTDTSGSAGTKSFIVDDNDDDFLNDNMLEFSSLSLTENVEDGRPQLRTAQMPLLPRFSDLTDNDGPSAPSAPPVGQPPAELNRSPAPSAYFNYAPPTV